jgi:hypothetical protein
MLAAPVVSSEEAWLQHKLTVVAVAPHSAINATNLPPSSSLYGVEGGQIIEVGGALYVAIAEFIAPPHFVPSNIALWRSNAPNSEFSVVAWYQ